MTATSLVLVAMALSGIVGDNSRLPASAIPYAPAATLVANGENSFRTIVPATHASGISQILALATRTDYEEQWVFIPAADLWIEIGRNETATEENSQVEIDTDYLTRIVELYHTVTIVHFHPAGYYARLWNEGPHAARDPVSAIAGETMQPLGYALPSPDDVVSSIDLSRLLTEADPEAIITYSVISPHGVVTYGPTPSGLRTILYEWGSPRATTARTAVMRLAIRRMEFNIAKTIGTLPDASIADIIAALCAQASDATYSLAYTPF